MKVAIHKLILKKNEMIRLKIFDHEYGYTF